MLSSCITMKFYLLLLRLFFQLSVWVLLIGINNTALAAKNDHYALNAKELKLAIKRFNSSQEALTYLLSIESQIEQWSKDEQASYFFLRGFQQEGFDYESALQDYNIAIDLSDINNPTDALIESLLGRSYVRYIQTHDANQYCPDRKLAVELSETTQDFDLKAKALTLYAFCFSQSDTFQQGTEFLQQALEIATNNDLSLNRKALINNATGELFNRNRLFEYSYPYIFEAYQLWKKANDHQDVFNMLHTLVSICLKLERYQEAQKYVNELHFLADSQPEFKDFKFFAFYNQGVLSKNQKQFQKAIYSFKQAIELEDTTEEKFFIDLTYANLAISLARINKIDEAVKYAKRPLANPINSHDHIYMSLRAIKNIHSGNYYQAMEQLFNKADFEVNNAQKSINNKVAYLSLEHRATTIAFENKLLEQDLAINQLELKNEQSKYQISSQRLTISVLATLVFIFISIFMYKSRRFFKRRAQTDYLTGIANRRYCFELGEKLINKCVAKKQPFSLLVFDIDHFKKINDSFGHMVGDNAIKMVAQQAMHWIKKDDHLGRIGGEEFLVLLPNIHSDEAYQIAERLRKGIASKTFSYKNNTINLTVSIGVAERTNNDENLGVLVNQADKALYKAKNKGRNCTVIK